MNQLDVPQQIINDFCKANGIRRLSFFGSVLRDDFNQNSDIDVLVEFDSSRRIGFLAMARMEIELTQILGRKVDLRTPAELSRYFRDDVLKGAQVQYEAA